MSLNFKIEITCDRFDEEARRLLTALASFGRDVKGSPARVEGNVVHEVEAKPELPTTHAPSASGSAAGDFAPSGQGAAKVAEGAAPQTGATSGGKLPTLAVAGGMKKNEIDDLIEREKLPLTFLATDKIADRRQKLCAYIAARQGGGAPEVEPGKPMDAPGTEGEKPVVEDPAVAAARKLRADSIQNVFAWINGKLGEHAPAKHYWTPPQLGLVQEVESFLQEQITTEFKTPEEITTQGHIRSYVAGMGCTGKCMTECPFGPGQSPFCRAMFEQPEDPAAPPLYGYLEAVESGQFFKVKPLPAGSNPMNVANGPAELVEQPTA